MLVQRILQFLQTLKQHGELVPCDVTLYKILMERFSSRDVQDNINTEDIEFITKCFTLRWKDIFDNKDTDYTLHPEGVNQVWIEFSKEIAPIAKKNYLNLLIPALANTRDYNNLSLLSETVRLENFYLGHDGITLYRKRGLCDHLINEHFKLSTCRDIRTRKLSAMSIEELSRLQSCKQPNGTFSIDSEQFYSFWDFLKKKSFTRLQASGEIPAQLLADLQQLIVKYFEFKKESADFNFFKNVFRDFLMLLSHNDLDNINYFYGVRLTYNDKEHYLLDLLILIYQAQSYDLDKPMIDLQNWLEVEKREQKQPKLLTSLRQVNIDNSDVGLLVDSNQSEMTHRCFSLILSLLTTEFTVFPFTGDTISLWDKSNYVFPEAAIIYSKLFPFIETNKPYEMLVAYQSIIKEFFLSENKNLGFFARATRFSSTDVWYKRVENGTLSEIGVYWLEPEVLFHSLLQLKSKTSIHPPSHLNEFLDELIHTYTQKNNNMLKMLRVNILFSEFMNKLTVEDQTNIIELVQSSGIPESKHNFIRNCIIYLGQRLFQTESTHCFISPDGIDQVSKVIDAYKAKLHSPDFRFEAKLSESMKDYLIDLSWKILTVKEMEEVESSAKTLDYLNAPT